MPRIDMRKNIKIADRPRENAKEVEFVMRLNLTVKNDDGDAIEQLEKFKKWTTDVFQHWDESVKQSFLYNFGLLQNTDDSKYKLNFEIDGLTKDDTQADFRPQVEDVLENAGVSIENKNNKTDEEKGYRLPKQEF